MARPLRVEFPGAVYHVTSRGNQRQDIFTTPDDRHTFFGILERTVQSHNWLCHAFCLMSNHYHLLIETPDGNLSRGMRGLNGVYTQAYNRRHRRVGHLLQGRYKAILVEKESYLLELARYIVLNPVRANMVQCAADYCWSSYHATAGLGVAKAFLCTDWILARFSTEQTQARQRYKQFVMQGINKEGVTRQAAGGVILGSETFIQQCRHNMQKTQAEVPRKQRFAGRPALSKLFTGTEQASRFSRNQVIQAACLEHGYTMVEVARYLDLHYSTVSKILNAR